MVGRGEQLAGLRQLCDLACAGSPAVALLGGDAGVGKTRLITEFTAGLVGSAVLLSGAASTWAAPAWRMRRSPLRCAGWSASLAPRM